MAVVSTADASCSVTVPGPERVVHQLVSDGGDGKPSSVTVPSSVAAPRSRTVASMPAATCGAWFVGGDHSMWRSAAAVGDDSYALATRCPEPVTSSAIALLVDHPGRSTSSCTIDASTGDRWASVT